MKRLAVSFLLAAAPVAALSLAACGGASSSGAAVAGDSTRVNGPEAQKLVAEGAFLLDVRTTQEFGDRHLEGATNIPVSDIQKRLSELPKDKPIVVYCASGGRSAMATDVLRDQGYDAKDLGPMSAWGR